MRSLSLGCRPDGDWATVNHTKYSAVKYTKYSAVNYTKYSALNYTQSNKQNNELSRAVDVASCSCFPVTNTLYR